MKKLSFVAALLLLASNARADDAPCRDLARRVFGPRAPNTNTDWMLKVAAVRVSARGTGGFATFTMNPHFSVASGLNNVLAKEQSAFFASKAGSVFKGKFAEVFPGRGNTDVDKWTFELDRNGKLFLTSNSWGDVRSPLAGAECFAGPDKQVVVQWTAKDPKWGHDYWTFLLEPSAPPLN
jgi:hypothetical protein